MLPLLLEDASSYVHGSMWFQLDGSSPHFEWVRNGLTTTFWIQGLDMEIGSLGLHSFLSCPPPPIFICGNLYHRSLGSQQLIKGTDMAAADNRSLPRQLVTVRGSIQCHCEVCVQMSGKSLQTSVICYDTHSLHWQIPARAIMYSKTYSEVTTENYYKGQNMFACFLSSTANKIIWYIMLKTSVFNFAITILQRHITIKAFNNAKLKKKLHFQPQWSAQLSPQALYSSSGSPCTGAEAVTK